MEKILISACLVGDNTRFDGGNCRNELVSELNQYYDLVPFCPEMEGGLPVPREPGEIFHDAVKTKKGKDITRFYNSGAEKALALCSFLGIKIAVLKENSPSCGVHHIYNGHFNSTTIVGSGITTSLLKSKGIRVISEEELPTFLEDCKEKAGKTALKIELEKQADLVRSIRIQTGPISRKKDSAKTNRLTEKQTIRKKENAGLTIMKMEKVVLIEIVASVVRSDTTMVNVGRSVEMKESVPISEKTTRIPSKRTTLREKKNVALENRVANSTAGAILTANVMAASLTRIPPVPIALDATTITTKGKKRNRMVISKKTGDAENRLAKENLTNPANAAKPAPSVAINLAHLVRTGKRKTNNDQSPWSCSWAKSVSPFSFSSTISRRSLIVAT